ncbi:DUF429 domain-containing protein [Halorubrum vacuolatum]|uniref:Predicted nuclease (RNAse H fold) n=1 Tax=Halorubrum vacuolatum TaxID=63740 RepID=A0A238VPL1_HALVU|nr:DUF429 domain-containing protein [Halorubrum vacuolatum]SNR36148.1 Predicted nuclease (RNAse H fold) [Halorubrum vacuolatum]
MATHLGVDWAGGRWVVVEAGDRTRVTTEPSILNVWDAHGRDARAVLIDIPIGLPPDRGATRGCDRAASEYLGGRGSTVFSIPCREAVESDDYDVARERHGAGISSQSWWLFPRIRAVDALLRTRPDARDRIYEGHPECCFAAFAGGALETKHDDDGIEARLDVLASIPGMEDLYGTVSEVIKTRREDTEWHERLPRSALDDVVDAAVLAATAATLDLGPRSENRPYPTLPDEDAGIDPELDVPMEIVYPGSGAETEPFE